MNLDYIVKPVITEKSFRLSQQSQFTFLVNPKANKHSIAQAIETLFKVDVTNVNLLNNHSKVKRSGNTRHQTIAAAEKKAVVTLKPGQTIEYFQLPEEKSTTTKAKKEVKKISKLKNVLKKAKSKSTTTKSKSSIRKGLASTSK